MPVRPTISPFSFYRIRQIGICFDKDLGSERLTCSSTVYGQNDYRLEIEACKVEEEIDTSTRLLWVRVKLYSHSGNLERDARRERLK